MTTKPLPEILPGPDGEKAYISKIDRVMAAYHAGKKGAKK